jgi:hypothetical protein
MAIITRCFMPPESSCGKPDGLGPGLPALHRPVGAQRLGDLRANPHHRVERGRGLLEDHPDASTANLAHLLFIERQQVASLEDDAPARDVPGLDQPEKRETGGGLTATRLADQRVGLSRLEPEGDAVHRANGTVRPRVVDVQVVDLKQRAHLLD